jgi:hypothetical protein
MGLQDTDTGWGSRIQTQVGAPGYRHRLGLQDTDTGWGSRIQTQDGAPGYRYRMGLLLTTVCWLRTAHKNVALLTGQ